MLTIQEVLPFLVPLAVVELALLAYTIHHILTHNTYKRGSRGLSSGCSLSAQYCISF